MKPLLDWFATHVLRRRTLFVQLITNVCYNFPAGPTSRFVVLLVCVTWPWRRRVRATWKTEEHHQLFAVTCKALRGAFDVQLQTEWPTEYARHYEPGSGTELFKLVHPRHFLPGETIVVDVFRSKHVPPMPTWDFYKKVNEREQVLMKKVFPKWPS